MDKNYDLYEDEKEQGEEEETVKTTTCIFIHGGAWMFGDTSKLVNQSKMLNDLGYRVVLPKYPLHIPSFHQILDLIVSFVTLVSGIIFLIHPSLILFLFIALFVIIGIFIFKLDTHNHNHHRHNNHHNRHNHRSDEQYDPIPFLINIVREVKHKYPNDRLVVIGFSAGAHLAALLAHRCGGVDTFDAFVGISGLYSSKRMSARIAGNVLHSIVFNSDASTSYEFPLFNINSKFPRTLLINAKLDFDLIAHTLDFTVWLKQNNVQVQTYIVPSKLTTHFSIMKWKKNRLDLLIHHFLKTPPAKQ